MPHRKPAAALAAAAAGHTGGAEAEAQSRAVMRSCSHTAAGNNLLLDRMDTAVPAAPDPAADPAADLPWNCSPVLSCTAKLVAAAAPAAGWIPCWRTCKGAEPRQSIALSKGCCRSKRTQMAEMCRTEEEAMWPGTQGLGFEVCAMWVQVEERSEVQLGQVGMSTTALRCGECGWR